MDLFWHKFKPKKAPTHLEKTLQKKSKHLIIFFDQSGVQKIQDHFLH